MTTAIPAIDRYLAPQSDRRTGIYRDDLYRAAHEAGEWRRDGPKYTAAILDALSRMGVSYRDLSSHTGITLNTVSRLIQAHRKAL